MAMAAVHAWHSPDFQAVLVMPEIAKGAASDGKKVVESGDFLAALFSFNLGIECGQIAVVGIAFALVSPWWKQDFYQRLIARPASAMIALTGLYWAVERGI